ncbi:YceI family protein [Geopsychrobacter electrodiphilus]|uniref:YceI family protein n=1 Tax=Geopsychrobacter electrodiphilus TaxID=225196 RepID=UPI000363182F|nr:YceI family protein [Geopsychrobacter electrodiphilus]
MSIALLFAFAQPGFSASYKIDPMHSEVGFTVQHLMFFKVSGYFTDFEDTIEADSQARTLSAAAAVIKTTSVDTRIGKRGNHLRSADFFDAAKFPEMIFVSKKVEGSGNDIKVYGDLTIRGTTKPIVLSGAFLGENKDAWGNVRAGFAAKGMINRKDFGLTWNAILESGGVTVGDDVEITLQVEAIKS